MDDGGISWMLAAGCFTPPDTKGEMPGPLLPPPPKWLVWLVYGVMVGLTVLIAFLIATN